MSKRTIRLILIGAALLIIGLIVYALIPRASLLMSIAPEDFTVTINGHSQQAKTGDSITVTPGDISLSVSRDGFDTYTQKLTIKNGEKVEILQALNPKTDDAKALLNTAKSQAVIQRVTNAKMKAATDQLVKNYPILAVLPINDKFYTITTCNSKLHPNDATKTAICVNLYDLEAKQSAIDDVKQRGFNLDNYETYFVDASYNSASQQNGD
jgi:hypothetical protein